MTEAGNPGDPASGDDALYRPGSYENYRTFGLGTLSPELFAQADRAFHDDVQAWLAGQLPYAVLLPHRDRLGLELRPHHDGRRLLPAEVALPDELLADIVEDEVPDLGAQTERITGDAFERPSVGALAALAWVDDLVGNRRAVDAWMEDERDPRLVAAARRVDRAPPCLYVDGVAQLPLSPRMTPPTGPPGIYVARAYRLGDGWAFSSRVAVDRLPDVATLIRRLQIEGWRLRTRERRATWEDVLRQRSDVLYRAVAEGSRLKFAGGWPKGG
ncbi:MAG: hypothetical protein EXR72_15270 [Myxococcales bacterium]|nr:hypothetical protein [Myxococcales bacterium]